ncbi:efflux RND transporter periplasmic adaptor subunit [Tepidicaulis sp. LMO-SS28]|uniref:efflux RND transporter periplasmic adaptor subunit n=1 Tax=Tepidicaulis sp. LMO-SS28 TaxID=3447455 RepID=UPI003EE14BB0
MRVASGWRKFAAPAMLAFALAACGDDEQSADGPPAIAVSIANVESGTIEDTVSSIATLEASQRVTIRPKRPETLVEKHFEEGEIVEKGDTLFSLDDSKLANQRLAAQAAVASAEARRADAQRHYERIRVLQDRGVSSNAQRDQAEADLKAARAELDRAKAELALLENNLSDTRIIAPFTGAISSANVDVGNYVETGDTLATLYAADPLKAQFTVPERYMNRLTQGLDVRVVVVAYPDKTFSGQVTYVSPGIDPQTRKLTLEALIDNPEGEIRPGAFGTIILVLNERENRPLIPEEALIATRTGYMVFVVEDGVAKARQVEIGLRRPGSVEITSGLKPGEQVIRSGHINVTDGARVRQAEGESNTEAKGDEVAQGL